MSKRISIILVIITLAVFGAGLSVYGQFNAAEGEPVGAPSSPQQKNLSAAPKTASGDEKPGQSGGPEIFLPETKYDFGSVAQGSKVTHKFIVKNVGDAPLKLIKAKGS